MGAFTKLFWGFLFFFDFRINGLDLLPDIVGYLFIYFGLVELAKRNHNFESARIVTIPLAFFSLFDLIQLQNQGNGIHLNFTSFFAVFLGLLITLINLFMVFKIVMGIKELSRQYGEYALEETANSRWLLYLASQFALFIIVPIGLLIPLLLAILFIPIFIFFIMVLIMMMLLMKQAEEKICA